MRQQTLTEAISQPAVRARRERIALFGHFGSGNLGNEGSLEAMLSFLRDARPDADISCICVDPEETRRAHGLDTLHVNWRPASPTLARIDRALLRLPGGLADLVRTVVQINRFDTVVVPGTGILDDFGTGPRGMPYGILKWSVAARLFGKRFWFVSIGAGPIHNAMSRWLMCSAARLADFRSFRDTVSKEYMQTIGLDVRDDPIFPDIAFQLPAPQTECRSMDRGGPLTVGVGVMTYFGWRQDLSSIAGQKIYHEYLAKMADFLTRLLDAGHRVRLLTGETSDARAVSDILTILNETQAQAAMERVAAQTPHSLHDLMQQIAETDLIVATRFHNIVCALKVGRPTISLGYAEKNDALLNEMGLGEFCQHIETFDVEILMNHFNSVCADLVGYARRVRSVDTRYRRRLAEQGHLLLARLSHLAAKPVTNEWQQGASRN